MTDALRDAELLAVAAVQGSAIAFAAYAAQREALSRALFEITDAIASFTWNLDTVRQLAPRTEHGNEARGRAYRGPFPARHELAVSAGEGSMTDTSSTTGIAITPWARTIKGRPAIGGFAERTRRTGMGDVAMFTEMTGDRNPASLRR